MTLINNLLILYLSMKFDACDREALSILLLLTSLQFAVSCFIHRRSNVKANSKRMQKQPNPQTETTLSLYVAQFILIIDPCLLVFIMNWHLRRHFPCPIQPFWP
jgi:hypothetical protein